MKRKSSRIFVTLTLILALTMSITSISNANTQSGNTSTVITPIPYVDTQVDNSDTAQASDNESNIASESLTISNEVHNVVEVTLLGPIQYVRTRKGPNIFTETFPAVPGEAQLIVINGEENGDNRISSGNITINGELVLGTNSTNQQVHTIETTISVLEDNEVVTQLASRPGSYWTIQITQGIEAEAAAVIEPNGGILSVTDENSPLFGFQAEFPENALNSSTIIQVRTVDDVGELPSYVESYCSPFEILPSGLVFNEPVIMTIPFDFGPLATTDFVYALLFDDTNNKWDRCGVISYNYAESTITVEAIHFSVGAVSKSTVDFSEAVYTEPAFNMDTDKYPIDQMGPECKGISVFTTWYFNTLGHGLASAYCEDRADYLAEQTDSRLFFHHAFHGSQDRSYVAKSLWFDLKNNKCPQLLNLKLSTDGDDIHMVVVYNYDGQFFNVHNSNYLYYQSENPQRIEVINGELTDYVYFDGSLSGKKFYDLFRYETWALSSDDHMELEYGYCPPDSDCDGISDDGNLSLSFGDNPCVDGNTEGCDDNCPCTYNPDQADSDGDGIGDVCESNLVLNPGFDCRLKSWSSSSGTARYESDADTHLTGSYSVMGFETNKGSLGRLYQDVTGIVSPGGIYKIGGWIKTESVDGCVVIALDYVTSGGWSPADGYVKEIGYVSGTQDWTYYESDDFVLPPMPADCVAAWFLLDFNNGEGKAWWDDLFLIRTGTELSYDDGSAEFGWATGGSTGGVAVRFTPPTPVWILSSIKVQAWYVDDDAPFYVEIWDKDRNELFTAAYSYSYYFTSTSYYTWAEIDIPDIVLTDDFYVCVFPNDTEDHTLWMCFDDDPPISNRSHTAIYTNNFIDYDNEWDWMIRAVGHP